MSCHSFSLSLSLSLSLTLTRSRARATAVNFECAQHSWIESLLQRRDLIRNKRLQIPDILTQVDREHSAHLVVVTGQTARTRSELEAAGLSAHLVVITAHTLLLPQRNPWYYHSAHLVVTTAQPLLLPQHRQSLANAKYWQSTQNSQRCHPIWSCTWSNLWTIFRSGLPNIRGGRVSQRTPWYQKPPCSGGGGAAASER